MKRIYEIGLIALMFGFGASLAHATPISSCQALTAGTYELTQDIECPTTGFGIGSNVTLDGQGHSVTYTGSSELASGFGFNSFGTSNYNFENISIKNIRFVNFPYAHRGVPGSTTSILRNIVLENIETSGGQSLYHRGVISFSAWSPRIGADGGHTLRYLDNVTFRNISIRSPYGYLDTGYLVNSLVDGVTVYGGSSLGQSIPRFIWSGLNSTIQNVQFTSDTPASAPPSGPVDQYLMTSLCEIDPLGYPRPPSPQLDPVLPGSRCGGMRLRNISFIGPSPRYDFRLGGNYYRLSGSNLLDSPGYASLTLEDSEIRRYYVQASAISALGPVPTELTFKRSTHGSIAISRVFTSPGTGENLFSSSPESEFVVENNRMKLPQSGPLAGSARLTFENLPLCWNAVQIHRNGQPCDSAICTQVERFGTRAIFDASSGGDYSLFVQSTHPECSEGGGMCTNPWDFNRDGTVNVADIFAFLTAWFAHSSPG